MDGSRFGIRKNFGFGFMRLPTFDNGDIDLEETKKMVDAFIEGGFNYFDTAHGYHDGRSEKAIKECLSSRYPRDRFVLTDKLSPQHFERKEDIRPLIESELEATGVEYFDFLLMHAQSAVLDEKYTSAGAYEVARELKEEGKIRHIGISFHDRAEVLRRILREHPEIEVVQIQLNYLDYDDPIVESRKVYEAAAEFGKPVIVMEPVKGGRLANPPESVCEAFKALGDASPASYAIRFAASFPNVMVVLSGMSNLPMVQENVSFMTAFKKLDEREMAAVEKAQKAFKDMHFIECTSCKYCMEVCPKGIHIPEIFSSLNSKRRFDSFNAEHYFRDVAPEGKRAGDCLKCGRCENICPQHLRIRDLLSEAKATFEE